MSSVSNHLSAASGATSIRAFRRSLLRWYNVNRRDLPWRKTSDPYRIWISEIMLQQTRVAAVLEHYRLFLQRFPNIRTLAAASEAEVLAAWSGLGYYRRARMMRQCAMQIVSDHQARFPRTSEALQSLPGIGRYTASAIASIAFAERVAVVDGNVERVLGRQAARTLTKKELWLQAQSLIDPSRPADFNQAMMELGATVCVPGPPRCLSCPVIGLCATRGNPVLLKLAQPKKSVRQKRRDICYALDHRNRSVFLVQRPKHASLMPGMWELPEIPVALGRSPASLTLRHSITVTDYTVHVMRGPMPGLVKGRWMPKARVLQLPLTGLARKILREAQVI
jgi:A/G-specific adenine glycosylase